MTTLTETLKIIRSLFPNPQVIILHGDKWSRKAKGYVVSNEQIPVFTDQELQSAVDDGKIIALNLPQKFGYIEFDPSETLGSVEAAEEWLAENMWRLERVQTVVVRTPRYGFHIWFIVSSDAPDFVALSDWLWVVQEDARIATPDVIHFRSVNASDYAPLPPSPGYEFLTKCRTIKRLP